MSEEANVELGQRELTAETEFESLSNEEKEMLARQAFDLLIDDVKESGPKTINTAIGSLCLAEKREDEDNDIGEDA